MGARLSKGNRGQLPEQQAVHEPSDEQDAAKSPAAVVSSLQLMHE